MHRKYLAFDGIIFSSPVIKATLSVLIFFITSEIMGLHAHSGLVSVGGPADLVVFRGRHYSELLSRPQLDRLVLRDGKPLTEDVPDYRELDDLERSLGRRNDDRR